MFNPYENLSLDKDFTAVGVMGDIVSLSAGLLPYQEQLDAGREGAKIIRSPRFARLLGGLGDELTAYIGRMSIDGNTAAAERVTKALEQINDAIEEVKGYDLMEGPLSEEQACRFARLSGGLLSSVGKFPFPKPSGAVQ